MQGRPPRQTNGVETHQGSRAETHRSYPRFHARRLQQPRGLGGYHHPDANRQPRARRTGHGKAAVPANYHSESLPPDSPRRHCLRPRTVQHARRQTVGLTAVHHLPSANKKATTATSQEEQRPEMHSLRAQTWIPTYLRSMRPMVLPVLQTETPLQCQHRWLRAEP